MDLSILAPITTAATGLSNLILVSPQSTIGYQPTPAGVSAQPPALLFHYEGEQTVTLESDITDHYVEDNTALQDQWTLKPEIVTTHGFIGELNNIPPKALAILKTAAEKLAIVDAYIPVVSATALIAYNEAFLLYQVGANAVGSAVSAWSTITGQDGENVINSSGLQTGVFNSATGAVTGNQTKQQVAFQQFYGYWKSRTLFTVQTPWAVFQNMAISRLRAIQDQDTKVITDFEVTFKMIRTANTETQTSGVASIFSGRGLLQAAGLTDFGTCSLGPSSDFSSAVSGMGVS